MHRLLRRQLDRLGLDGESAPVAGLWKLFLERVSASYTQSDENRQLSERSIEISSREMQELHERERRANERLEERVKQRTADLAQAEIAARASEARYRSTFDNAPIGIMHTSIDGDRILDVNPKLCKMLGYTYEELLGLTTNDLLLPEELNLNRSKYRQQMLRGEINAFSSERRYLRKDGSILWVNRTISLARDAKDQPLYFIRVIEDISERIAEARTRDMEHTVTQILAESATVEEAIPLVLQTICQALGWACGAYWKWNQEENILQCADTWQNDMDGVAGFITATREGRIEVPPWQGANPEMAVGGVVRRVWFTGTSDWHADVTQQEDFRRGPEAVKAGLRSAFGFPLMAEARPLGVVEFYSYEIEKPNERLLQMVRSIGSQVGQFLQRKQAEDKLAFLAQFDTITNLPNRFLLNDRLRQMLTQSRRNNWSVGILFVDLDRFKAVNDNYGHAVGDALLREVAIRMLECVRGGDTIGRLSGDEFIVMLPNMAKADDAGLVAQKLVESLAMPFNIDGHKTYISASIGIVVYPVDGTDPESLLKNADTAMYRAKEQGRNGYQFYLPEMNERLLRRRRLETSLHGALERNEFHLHYQPKVSLSTGAITGFESLLRWWDGERMVSPVEFISILEDNGQIVPVGEWVLKNVCEQIKQWMDDDIPPCTIAVNLSTRQFQRKNLVDVVGAALRETGINPALLKLELTESLLMSDAHEAVETLKQLKQLGVLLSVDDFGTGYSSLAYLKRFPLDELKIDREFICDALSDPEDATIALTIINLAHSLKLKVVAEGVETEGQLNFLRLHDCDEVQGYFLAYPQAAKECTPMLVSDKRLILPENGIDGDTPMLQMTAKNKN